jgi:hypothetical protein
LGCRSDTFDLAVTNQDDAIADRWACHRMDGFAYHANLGMAC